MHVFLDACGIEEGIIVVCKMEKLGCGYVGDVTAPQPSALVQKNAMEMRARRTDLQKQISLCNEGKRTMI
jgi:hypothetical protein